MIQLRILALSSLFILGGMADSAYAATARFAGATVASVKGRVEVLLDGVPNWLPAKEGLQLTPGSQVRSGRGADAVIIFFDGSKVRIGALALLKLEGAAPSKIALFMGVGKLEAWVKKMAERTFQTRSASAVASVRGTIYTFDVEADGDATVNLFDGRLVLTDTFGHNITLNPGQSVSASSTDGFSQPGKTDDKAPEEPVVETKKKEEAPAEEKKEEEKKEKEEEKAPEETKDEGTKTQNQGPPPPNPAQNCTATASPSAPCQ